MWRIAEFVMQNGKLELDIFNQDPTVSAHLFGPTGEEFAGWRKVGSVRRLGGDERLGRIVRDRRRSGPRRRNHVLAAHIYLFAERQQIEVAIAVEVGEIVAAHCGERAGFSEA